MLVFGEVAVGSVAVVAVVVDIRVVVVEDVVDWVQDTSNIVASSKKLKPNHIALFFNLYLHLINHERFFAVMAISSTFLCTSTH